VDHPPPVKSFEGGIPYCALGYVVDGRWLDRYAHEHGLVKEDGTTLHRDSPMNEAIFYLLDKTKQRDIMCKRIGDGMIRREYRVFKGYLELMNHLPGYAQRSNVIVSPQLALQPHSLFSCIQWHHAERVLAFLFKHQFIMLNSTGNLQITPTPFGEVKL
ncbi:hypothetical protein ABKN59_012014, partial [Abortiporus biennis]